MQTLLAELKRRQMFRVAAAYAVVAWLLLQVVNNVAPVLDLPVWVARAFLLALVIGFPIALLFVWMRDLAPSDAAAPRPATTKLDYVLAGGLVLVIALLSYQQLAPSGDADVAQQVVAAPSAASPTDDRNISIAVLPLANLSGDASQDFFSDGVTDEITTALTKVPTLRVVGRTSAFQFKGQNRDAQAIAQALRARFIIDGSVRRLGDRVRVTAQLIQADNGVNLWADNYDRQLTDVFAIQEEIAQAIASALQVPLGLPQGQALVSNRTADLDSYQQYLRARALMRARAVDEAITILEPVVARDPEYAPAWALLSNAYGLAGVYNGALLQGGYPEEQQRMRLYGQKAEMAAREAIRLDPRDARGYAALADFEVTRGRPAATEDLFRQALAIDPGDPDTLDRFSQRLVAFGRIREGLRIREQLRALEPFVPIFTIFTASFMELDGQSQAAIALLEATPATTGAVGARRNQFLARAYATAGRYREAADVLLAIPADQNLLSRKSVEDAARLLRSAPAKATSDSLPPLAGGLDFAYMHVDAADRVLENRERYLDAGGVAPFPMTDLWHPSYAPLRKTERFKDVVRRIGFVDYWRARGWPDLCRPVGADDFVCD